MFCSCVLIRVWFLLQPGLPIQLL